MLYSLRVFQRNQKGEYTNTQLKRFELDGTLTITTKEFETLDWESCVFQVYPSNPQTQSFYAFPDGQSLYLFNTKTDALMGKTSFSDQYIYFKPATSLEDSTFQLRLQ